MKRLSVNPLQDMILLFSLIRIFLRERPQYVFLYTIKPNIFGTIAARVCRIHSSMMMAGLGRVFTNNSLSSYIARALYRLALAFSDHLLLLNDENVETVKKLGMCKKDKIVRLKSGEGVNLQRFQFHDNKNDKVSFLFVGRLLREKGVLDFVEAARLVKQQCHEAEFQVAGGTDTSSPDSLTREEIESFVASDIIDYLGIIDMVKKLEEPGLVIVIPSYYSEGLNHSLMVGCATGKPIITTDWPGCRETVIEGRNGYLVPTKNPEALAEAMLRYIILTDDEKQVMSQESRRLAEQCFDVKSVYAVYDKILGIQSC